MALLCYITLSVLHYFVFFSPQLIVILIVGHCCALLTMQIFNGRSGYAVRVFKNTHRYTQEEVRTSHTDTHFMFLDDSPLSVTPLCLPIHSPGCWAFYSNVTKKLFTFGECYKGADSQGFSFINVFPVPFHSRGASTCWMNEWTTLKLCMHRRVSLGTRIFVFPPSCSLNSHTINSENSFFWSMLEPKQNKTPYSATQCDCVVLKWCYL